MKKLYFTTLAEFKRLAVRNNYMKGCYYEKEQGGWRKIVGVQTNGVYLYGGKTRSFFGFPKARDCEIVNGVLKIYQDRVKYGNSDIPSELTWFREGVASGRIKEEEVKRYRKQIAEYEIGKE